MNEGSDGRRPRPVDVHVGGRVRMRRKMIGVSQEQLADALGLTFQQVQKYELGSNRVSASKLYEIAKILKVPIAFFFVGLVDTATNAKAYEASRRELVIRTFLNTPEGLELAAAFPRIGHGRVSRELLDLIRMIADETAPDDAM
ncbi:MAG TPA: helix-turn-helix domain-containing protein [Caulobacter sp.]|nr:helix-turn-helix domain-containing protein [Caulobacter sp.]